MEPQRRYAFTIGHALSESGRNASSAGVVPISDSNAFSRTHLAALEPYAFTFTRERIEQAVEAVLAAPAEALQRTESTWQDLAVRFGMQRSARQIVQFSALHVLNAVCGR